MTDTKPTTDEHSCSYHCDRPECIKAQRDSMREELKRIREAEMPVEPKVYQQQFFCDDGTIESHDAVLKHDYDSLKAYAQRKDAPCYYHDKREWVGLTDEEIKDIVGRNDPGGIGRYTRDLIDKIEAKLKEKNT